MAKKVLKDASITVNAVNVSNHCSKVTINSEYEAIDSTAFGSILKETLQGMGDGSIVLTLQQDYDAGSIDATMWPLSQSGATFPVVAKPSSAAVSATNPSYTMTGVLLSYAPLDGEVGALLTTEVNIPNASPSGIVRATS